MKNGRQVFLFILLPLFLAPGMTYAETSVNISNNGSGASSDVEIHNSINSSNSSSNTSNSHTSVRIETNGVVKTYESDNGGSVHIESDDGTAKVNINNNNSTVTPKVKENEVVGSSEAREKLKIADQKLNAQKTEFQKSQKSFFQKIGDYLKSMFSHFSFKFW